MKMNIETTAENQKKTLFNNGDWRTRTAEKPIVFVIQDWIKRRSISGGTINKCEAVVGIRNVYDYLIHDTEDCRKKGKEQYDPSERITGNNFDIGAYEQLGTAEKNEMFLEMGEAIREHGFTNYMDFYEYVVDTYDDMNYIEVMRAYSSHFERLTRGNHHKWEQGRLSVSKGRKSVSVTSPDTLSDTPDTLSDTLCCCPACGSIDVKKNGKTLAGIGRLRCKDCGKSFVDR